MSYSVYIKDGSDLVQLPTGTGSGGSGVSVTTETYTPTSVISRAIKVPDHGVGLLLFYNGLLMTEGADYKLRSDIAALAFTPEGDDVITAVAFTEG